MGDRNFDDLADRFASRIYGGLKGAIRQAVITRDLEKYISSFNTEQLLKVADLGGGLGQFSIKLGALGHHVSYNDLSLKMMEKAQASAQQEGIYEHIQWYHCPYQHFIQHNKNRYDLILCHALLEWLQEPEHLIYHAKSAIRHGGYLSLCFYNPVGLVYRNLMCGNFRYLNRLGLHQEDPGSLTPENPCNIESVERWLRDNGFQIICQSGIRVFSDYVLEKRGGNLSDKDVLKRELEYSQLEPYKQMGRYIHLIAKY